MDAGTTAVIASAVTGVTTGFGAFLLHKRESKKVNSAGEVATAALHRELDTRMRDHVAFVENRIKAEREWYQRELERERDDCAESIDNLAGRLGRAEAELRKFRGASSASNAGRLPSSGGVEGSGP